MKRIQMLAKQSLVYAGKRYAQGSEVPVRTKSDARLLAAIGRAELAPVVTAPPPAASAPPVAIERKKPAARTELQEATPSVEPQSEEKVERPKRTYRRRDMDAESGSNEA